MQVWMLRHPNLVANLHKWVKFHHLNCASGSNSFRSHQIVNFFLIEIFIIQLIYPLPFPWTASRTRRLWRWLQRRYLWWLWWWLHYVDGTIHHGIGVDQPALLPFFHWKSHTQRCMNISVNKSSYIVVSLLTERMLSRDLQTPYIGKQYALDALHPDKKIDSSVFPPPTILSFHFPFLRGLFYFLFIPFRLSPRWHMQTVSQGPSDLPTPTFHSPSQ